MHFSPCPLTHCTVAIVNACQLCHFSALVYSHIVSDHFLQQNCRVLNKQSLSGTFPDAPCRKTSSMPLVDDSLVLSHMRAKAPLGLQTWTTRKHAKALHTACTLATLSKGCCTLPQMHLMHWAFSSLYGSHDWTAKSNTECTKGIKQHLPFPEHASEK